jgi:hypothetical protein
MPARLPFAILVPGLLALLLAPVSATAPDQDGSKKTDHWAYRPLVKPGVPQVKQGERVRTPVDAFILAKLEANGMTLSPPADRRTLLRRVYFDLTGLPPTPEATDAFLADPSADAYEKVVDRLLASSRYGERWARHWMDVIHFAETHGNDQDAPRENAWPYRDYLVRSFNDDKPYARFAEEQLAGDALFPDDPQAIVATGFLAAGPWDESSQKDIRDDTVDKKVAQNLDRDDMVTTAMSTFVSTTVHCARCHNHKFDPITQAEYYGLQADFAGVDRAERPFDPDPAVAKSRRELVERRRELESRSPALAAELGSAAVRAEVAAWERSLGDRGTVWMVLDPSAVTSAGGSTPEKQPDSSVRFTGPRPAVDTYTITASADLKGISAVRLEVLTDDSLPHHGPGRQDNGNLHLSEFRVEAAPKANPAARRSVPVKAATADFDQTGWDVSRAIDGKMETAWGIYPEVGKPHEAVFEFAQPVDINGGAALTFTLEQRHGGGHLIGRLRLSATAAHAPVRVGALPPAVARALAVPPESRGDADYAELARYVLLQKVEARIAALPPQQMVYAATGDFRQVGSFKPAKGCRSVSVLKRGDVNSPREAAVPGALACMPGLPYRFALARPDDEGARRAALAKWVTDPHNVLTWRSIVNRIWQYHFGRGIVATPSDLGRMGASPTHPELLDWLAVTFRDEQCGSLKKLHRLLVTSAAYMQSSKDNPDYAKRDGDNQLLWRMNASRLDAESVRDAVLQVSGKLDLTMGGPSVKHFIQTKGIHVTPNVDYQSYDPDAPGSYRRSIYRFLFRTLPDPFMDALDCPDASQFAPTRASSVTALQALALLNDRFMVRQCEHFAARVAGAGNTEAQVGEAYRLALGRPPTPKESTALAGYANKHGMANACRLLLNSNEFMFVP